jgi:hypothetical protein
MSRARKCSATGCCVPAQAATSKDEGVWRFEEDDDATSTRYTWRLDLNTRWMRLSAPLMAPVFRWNHEGVMHGGAEGLARYLGARLLSS